MRMNGKLKPFTFPIEDVAFAFFANAKDASMSENEDFYWARYGGLDFEFCNVVGEQNNSEP